MFGGLFKANELRVPLHVHAPLAQGFSEQPLVVVLTQDQKKRIRTQITPDVTERYACSASPFDPHVCAGRARAQLEGTLDNPEVGVDLEGARLHPEGLRLDRRAGVPVDDQRANAATPELIPEHQPGRAGTDDKHVNS